MAYNSPMLMPDLNAFIEAAPQGRLLGLDLGEKTIGLALSDSLRMVATPAEIIARNKFSKDAAHLQRVIAEQRVTGLILGYPRNMDGSEGARCQATRQFVRNLEPLIDLPILLWDERLTTEAVTKTMLEADLSRQRRKEMVDKLAASFMLQGMLDRLRGGL